jgi:iron-sulfur cluster assembly protein
MDNISISEEAIDQLREQLLNGCLEAGIGFRIEVNKDEAGKVNFSIRIDRQKQDDKVLKLEGVKVFLNPASALYIDGYRLDYENEPDGGFFLNATQEVKDGNE